MPTTVAYCPILIDRLIKAGVPKLAAEEMVTLPLDGFLRVVQQCDIDNSEKSKICIIAQSGSGVGDAVAQLAEASGIASVTRAYTRKTGKECRCRQRQTWINRHIKSPATAKLIIWVATVIKGLRRMLWRR